MARKRRRTTVTDRLIADWVKSHNEGKTVTQISDESQVDRRTVQHYLPHALEEARWTQIRDSVDRDGLHAHFELVRDEARRVLATLQLPDRVRPDPWHWPARPDGSPMEDVLRSHFQDSAAWTPLARWQELSASYAAGFGQLNEVIKRMLDDYKLPADAVAGMKIQVVAIIQGSEPPEPIASLGYDDANWRPAREKIIGSTVARRMKQHWSELGGVRDELQAPFVQMAFGVRIPGECVFCS